MLIETTGGLRLHRGRLLWLDAGGGFTPTYVEHLLGPDSMVVDIK
jgi:hypothetical protein